MNEHELFAVALEIQTAGERSAYLDRACGCNEGLRARIEALLRAHERAGSFLAAPPDTGSAALAEPKLPEGPGTVIGPYKLLQKIGEGGMGTVYMAEQARPVRRLVALKVIKSGMDSRQVLVRFGAERQALALMEHPNIARILDAGATESGRPYFVMELVKGVPINRYSDDHRLTLRERLELLIPVCQAVQHAHQKGVIHRDLKPSNILIAQFDGRPVPKVIDFGVAKATGPRLTDQTLYTDFGAVVGTLEYMSPEQAELNQADEALPCRRTGPGVSTVGVVPVRQVRPAESRGAGRGVGGRRVAGGGVDARPLVRRPAAPLRYRARGGCPQDLRPGRGPQVVAGRIESPAGDAELRSRPGRVRERRDRTGNALDDRVLAVGHRCR